MPIKYARLEKNHFLCLHAFLYPCRGLCFDSGSQWHCPVCTSVQPPVHRPRRKTSPAPALCYVLQVWAKGDKNQGGIAVMSKHLAGGDVTYRGDASLPLVTPPAATLQSASSRRRRLGARRAAVISVLSSQYRRTYYG